MSCGGLRVVDPLGHLERRPDNQLSLFIQRREIPSLVCFGTADSLIRRLLEDWGAFVLGNRALLIGLRSRFARAGWNAKVNLKKGGIELRIWPTTSADEVLSYWRLRRFSFVNLVSFCLPDVAALLRAPIDYSRRLRPVSRGIAAIVQRPLSETVEPSSGPPTFLGEAPIRIGKHEVAILGPENRLPSRIVFGDHPSRQDAYIYRLVIEVGWPEEQIGIIGQGRQAEVRYLVVSR